MPLGVVLFAATLFWLYSWTRRNASDAVAPPAA
jgi:hypothetical protein